MTDELTGLLARARQLEQENASLRAIQSPDGDDLALRCENAMLSSELRQLRARQELTPPQPRGADAAPTPADSDGQMPRTLAEFSALPPAARQRLAANMTSRQRDELLGRGGNGRDESNYL